MSSAESAALNFGDSASVNVVLYALKESWVPCRALNAGAFRSLARNDVCRGRAASISLRYSNLLFTLMRHRHVTHNRHNAAQENCAGDNRAQSKAAIFVWL
jgi:hypothetical protein